MQLIPSTGIWNARDAGESYSWLASKAFWRYWCNCSPGQKPGSGTENEDCSSSSLQRVLDADSRVGRVRTVVNARDDILTTRTSTQVLSIPILLCNYAGASSFHYYADRIMIPTW